MTLKCSPYLGKELDVLFKDMFDYVFQSIEIYNTVFLYFSDD
jgi:hypothetical protein